MTEKNYIFKTKVITFVAFLLVALSITLLNNTCVSAKSFPDYKQTTTVYNADNVLSAIDKYQERYFTIVKRNDVLLNFEDSKLLNNDRKELKKLFNEVKKQISDKKYLNEYKKIEKRYSKCTAVTTPEINEFASNNYNEVDAMLNKVYKDVQAKISSKDFQNLTLSEKKWLKEVNDYQKVFDSMQFGTIGTSTYYEYKIDMIKFRTLLLMLYL